MVKTYKVRAVKRGTVTVASGQYHFDPNGVERARLRRVPADVYEAAKKKGLVEETRKNIPGEDDDAPLSIGEQAGLNVDESEGTRGDPSRGIGGGDTRDATLGSGEGFQENRDGGAAGGEGASTTNVAAATPTTRSRRTAAKPAATSEAGSSTADMPPA
jgi:hypothetical protein